MIYRKGVFMNTKIKKVLKNISYSFIANIISMIISVISVTFLPRIMSVEDYGAWQLYLFYMSYIGFFHFGWLDGICLRYGGCYFEKLDKIKFTSQFILLFIIEFIISIIALIVINLFIENYLLKEILTFVSYILIPIILFTFSTFILQITNKIKEYVYLTLLGRILFFISLMIYFNLDNRSYVELIYFDIISRILSLFYGIYLIKGILVFKLDRINNVVKEMWENISVGSKLLFANIAGMLILGIIRFGISQQWDVSIFGKISLTLNCSNFLMVFINAISIVFFPILKRIDESKIRDLYIKIRIGLTSILLGGLLVYYPLNSILSWWLPKYQDSLIYMAVLLPICLFESKVSLLTNTYLKALRKEKIMMKINLGVVIISFILTYISTVLLHDLNIAVISILLLFAIKSICSEIVLEKILEIQIKKDILQETILVILFVSINFCSFHVLVKFVIYMTFFILYLYINRKVIINSFKALR